MDRWPEIQWYMDCNLRGISSCRFTYTAIHLFYRYNNDRRYLCSRSSSSLCPLGSWCLFPWSLRPSALNKPSLLEQKPSFTHTSHWSSYPLQDIRYSNSFRTQRSAGLPGFAFLLWHIFRCRRLAAWRSLWLLFLWRSNKNWMENSYTPYSAVCVKAIKNPLKR